ncbi:MAG TPA: hypothetical protein ENO24_03820 [Chloroflexi bacterium]|nr:hypothetical protein [Chloroflexota bacterium]
MTPIYLLGLLFVLIGALLVWLHRGLLMSLAVRLLASTRPNAVKRHGLRIDFGKHAGPWIRLTLQANLGKTLSQVLGHPVEAAAYSRFAGFNLNRRYSDFLNPQSPYYQCWLGAYAVFDSESRTAFGFDELGTPVERDILAALEADQRLVYRSTGCPHRFPDGNAVRLRGELAIEQMPAAGDGLTWWRASGLADTWSAYHKGASPAGSRLRSLVYGTVPLTAHHPVSDYHPLTYEGEFWLRYFPEYRATCAKFCIWPSSTLARGQQALSKEQVVQQSRELLQGITFARQ